MMLLPVHATERRSQILVVAVMKYLSPLMDNKCMGNILTLCHASAKEVLSEVVATITVRKKAVNVGIMLSFL